MLPSGDVAVYGGYKHMNDGLSNVTLLDGASGAALWSTTPVYAGCWGTAAVVVDAAGVMYGACANFNYDDDTEGGEPGVFALGPSGHVRWTLRLPEHHQQTECSAVLPAGDGRLLVLCDTEQLQPPAPARTLLSLYAEF